MNKNESKYFNTARKMDEALITLLEKKDFAYITVKEICAVAGVNRSTFYLHYDSVVDLLKETTQYIMDRHMGYYLVDAPSVTLEFDDCEQTDLLFVTPEYLLPYLTFVKENQRIFKVSMKNFHSMGMDNVYTNMFSYVFNPILARFRVPEQERHYIMKFYLTGVYAIVIEWLEKDCADDINDISRIIIACVMGKRTIDGRSY